MVCRYGGEAGQFTEHTLYAAGNVGIAAYNFNNLGVKAVAKRAAKDTGKALVQEHSKASGTSASAQSKASGTSASAQSKTPGTSASPQSPASGTSASPHNVRPNTNQATNQDMATSKSQASP